LHSRIGLLGEHRPQSDQSKTTPEITAMRVVFLTVFALSAASAYAADPIVPTETPVGDCVSARISTKKTAQHVKYDQLYCALNQQQAAYENCMRNPSDSEYVDFFTDRCGSESDEDTDIAFVGFNGKTYRVSRPRPARTPLVAFKGTYKGEYLEVRVTPRNILSREYEGSELIGISASVDVLIRYRGQSTKIRGTYSHGP
jgi:hypothetical protein